MSMSPNDFPILEHGLGRRPAPDPRDQGYQLRTLLAAPLAEAPAKLFRYWNQMGWWGDQGPTSQCVAFAWAHYLEDGPVTQPGKGPILAPASIYAEAQKVDEWPGEGYDGTSVRAGAKVLQKVGFVSTYAWAWDLNTVIDSVLAAGPVVMGTNWYRSMFDPDPEGIVEISGPLAGGHAWVINGANRTAGLVRCKNSWSRSWGKKGNFYLSFESLARLIAEDGEACMAVEVKSVAPHG